MKQTRLGGNWSTALGAPLPAALTKRARPADTRAPWRLRDQLAQRREAMQLESVKVLEEIRAAFHPQPIHAEDAFKQWGASYPDARPFREQLEGKAWDRLDRAYILRRSDALGFLGTRHLVAVLPVYLCSLVEDGVWSPAAGMLTLILAKPLPGDDGGLGGARFDELAEALTDAQRAAIASALRAFATTDEDGSLGTAARAALDRHWSLYVPAGA